MARVTEDEARNGWSSPELAAYLNERESAAAERIDPTARQVRPTMANHRYSVKGWRR